jgi:hypothetical protein
MDVTRSLLAVRRSLPPLAVLLGFPLAPLAQAASPLPTSDPGASLFVLLVGLGMILVAVAVITLAVRELRRQARERRKLYRRRGPPHHGHEPVRHD